MPRPKNRLRGRREWTQDHLLHLQHDYEIFGEGWAQLPLLCPDARHFATLADVPPDVAAEMRDCWAAHGAAIMAEHLRDFPGCRPWFVWTFELLPADPRRQVRPDWPHDCSLTPPTSTWPWEEHGGHESSMVYLDRRGLWQPGERERVVEMMRQRGLTV